MKSCANKNDAFVFNQVFSITKIDKKNFNVFFVFILELLVKVVMGIKTTHTDFFKFNFRSKHFFKPARI